MLAGVVSYLTTYNITKALSDCREYFTVEIPFIVIFSKFDFHSFCIVTGVKRRSTTQCMFMRACRAMVDVVNYEMGAIR